MSLYHRSPLVFAVLGLTVAAGALLFIQDYVPAAVISSGNQALYAELPTGFPAMSSSTEKVIVPIVVYHIVRPSYPNDIQSVRALAHTPEVFGAEMKYLADAGYHVISFRALENHFQNGTPLPAKSIIISFDDGWGDQFEYAFPILKKYNYTATFFVFTNSIGTRGFLTWDNLRALLNAGMTIGSHSRSHPFLTKITSPTALWNEIYGSKQVLEKNLNTAITEFAYPFGKYDAAIVDLVKKAGYASARGDYYYSRSQSPGQIYSLSALNAPTTTALFAQAFPG